MLYTFTELVKRANVELARAGFDDEISERSVRHYTRVKALRPGRTLSELEPDEKRQVQERAGRSVKADLMDVGGRSPRSSGGGELKGNIRFYRDDDVDQLVALKIALLNGKTLEELGYRSPERPLETGMRSMSFNSARSPISSMPIDDLEVRSVHAMLDYPTFDQPAPTAFESVVARAALPELLPHPEESWTLRLSNALTLVGRGDRPTSEAVRALLDVVHDRFPTTPPPRDLSSDSLVIEIELADICAPFRGAVVNASNSDLTMGGGVSGSIWRNCGEAQLDAEVERVLEATGRRRTLLPGEALWTGPAEGKRLGFTGVIHAHGPRWTSRPRNPDTGDIEPEHGEVEELRRTWRSVLKVADARGERAIAAPLISTGLFGFPTPEGFEIAMETLLDTPTDVRLVVLRTFSQKAFGQLVDVRHSVLEARGLI